MGRGEVILPSPRSPHWPSLAVLLRLREESSWDPRAPPGTVLQPSR